MKKKNIVFCLPCLALCQVQTKDSRRDKAVSKVALWQTIYHAVIKRQGQKHIQEPYSKVDVACEHSLKVARKRCLCSLKLFYIEESISKSNQSIFDVYLTETDLVLLKKKQLRRSGPT